MTLGFQSQVVLLLGKILRVYFQSMVNVVEGIVEKHLQNNWKPDTVMF